ncbi:MAG: hypothetical protein M1377_05075 [Deltaproteobacteria bacterium]|nr:hypothetical protein [Deltaproteobacteria bacterium]
MTKVFPTILIVLDVVAAAVYAMEGWSQWRMAVYWAAAAVLTYTVTW